MKVKTDLKAFGSELGRFCREISTEELQFDLYERESISSRGVKKEYVIVSGMEIICLIRSGSRGLPSFPESVVYFVIESKDVSFSDSLMSHIKETWEYSEDN